MCTEDTVRLVNGSTEQEGRIEVCVNGVWGSICDQGWDTDDGDVVCQQLGYTRQGPIIINPNYYYYYYCLYQTEPTIFNNSYYGDGNYPIVYSNINCRGWENAITDCNKDNYLEYTCPSGHVAGLRCNGVPSANQQTADYSSIVEGVLGVVLFIVVVIVVVIVVLLIMRYVKLLIIIITMFIIFFIASS